MNDTNNEQITDDIFAELLNDEPTKPITPDPVQPLEPVNTVATPDPEPKRTLDKELIASLERTEELEAEIVKQNGRYIASVDNVKPGKTIYGEDNTQQTIGNTIFAEQNHVAYRSAGVNTYADDNAPLDTGSNAQTTEEIAPNDYDINDPRSPDFMVCMNSVCRYRESCLRYRLLNKRDNKGLFFPEQCRTDGTYISVDNTEFTAYDSFQQVDDPSAPSSLGEPE